MKIRDLFETSPHYDTKDIIDYWIEKEITHGKIKYGINDSDGSINLLDEVFFMTDKMLDPDGTFPIKIKFCHRLVITGDISSFKNFPLTISGNNDSNSMTFKFRVETEFDKLKSFEGCPFNIFGTADFTRLKHISYSKIDDHIKRIETGAFIAPEYKGPLLSFLKVKDLKWIEAHTASDCEKACAIITKYLKTNRDIFECKEELVNAGLKEYAKL